jgi:prepilin-type N-terminal cleavage/methylation domain-containing protein
MFVRRAGMTLVEVIMSVAMLGVLLALVAGVQNLLGGADQRQKRGLAFDDYEIARRLDFDLDDRFSKLAQSTGNSKLTRCLQDACDKECEQLRDYEPIRWGMIPIRMLRERRESSASDWVNKGGAFRADESLAACEPTSKPTRDGDPPYYQELSYPKICQIRAAAFWKPGAGSTVEILLRLDLEGPSAKGRRELRYRIPRGGQECFAELRP